MKLLVYTDVVLVLLLLDAQEMRHKVCGSLLHVQILCLNAWECSRCDLQLLSQFRDSDASVSWAGFLMHSIILCVFCWETNFVNVQHLRQMSLHF